MSGKSAGEVVLPKRVFHLTHVRNLPSIIEAGMVMPAAALRASGITPEVSLASDLVHELRESAEAMDGVAVSACVPMSVTPAATWWAEVRDGAAGPTWSAAARRVTATEFVVLGVDVESLPDAIVTDGDAAARLTSVSTPDTRQRMFARAATDPEMLARSEVLVPGPLPLAKVALVAVASEPRRDEVRAMLGDAGVLAPGARVVVYPPWFVGELGE